MVVRQEILESVDEKVPEKKSKGKDVQISEDRRAEHHKSEVVRACWRMFQMASGDEGVAWEDRRDRMRRWMGMRGRQMKASRSRVRRETENGECE
jgi:hypothetical protein